MKNNSLIFLSHPYHRGGVTQWMASAFNSWNRNSGTAVMVTVNPARPFISAANRPTVYSLVNPAWLINTRVKNVNFLFELGSLQYRAHQYYKLLLTLENGGAIIPSDDEACWLAAAMCSTRFKMVGVLHGDDESYFTLARKYKQYVSSFVCVSQRIMRRLLSEHPDLKSKVIALPCGIDIMRFAFQEPKQDVICWIGRLCVNPKRAQDIIPIFKRVRENCPQARLIILGDGDYSPMLKKEIEESELQEWIGTPGWLSESEVRRILSNSRILLQTSDYEGTSVAMMEALASGCAIVSSRVSGVEDLETHELAPKIVRLFEIGDIGSASLFIHQVLQEPYSAELGSQSRLLAEMFFDIEANTQTLYNFTESQGYPTSRQNHKTVTAGHVFASMITAIARWVKWQTKRIH